MNETPTYASLKAWTRPATRTEEDDWRELAECRDYRRFAKFMTGAVLGKFAQPVYGEFDLDNQDNEGWWFKTKRWRQVCYMNRCGLVTLQAQEGRESYDDMEYEIPRSRGVLWQDTRVTLYFLCQLEHLRPLVEHMREKGFYVAWRRRDGGPPPPSGNDTVWNVTTTMHADGGCSFDRAPVGPWPYEEMFQRDPPASALEGTASVVAIDPKSNRIAHAETGLFTTLCEYLRGSRMIYEVGLL